MHIPPLTLPLLAVVPLAACSDWKPPEISYDDTPRPAVLQPEPPKPVKIVELLKTMQKDLFERARKYRDAATYEVNSWDEFAKKIEEPGGFLWAHWDGTRATEDRIAAETKATIRCIPFNRPNEAGKCMVTGQPSAGRVVFAKAY